MITTTGWKTRNKKFNELHVIFKLQYSPHREGAASSSHTDAQRTQDEKKAKGGKSVTAVTTLPVSFATEGEQSCYNIPQSQSKEKGEEKLRSVFAHLC